MDLSLKGMKALVCGSSQGIGKEIALDLANEGVEVVLMARSEEKLKRVINKLSVKNNQKHKYIIADFEDDDDLNKKIISFDKTHNTNFDILINNTGGPPPGRIVDAEVKDFEIYMKNEVNFLTKKIDQIEKVNINNILFLLFFILSFSTLKFLENLIKFFKKEIRF